MFSKLHNKEKGFTIIEVVLVLAIAGLIFLIVFLALPALQRSRRDTQRESDAGRVLAQLENYAGNNNGVYPTANGAATVPNFGDFITRYLPAAEYSDPSSGSTYTFVYGTAATPALGQMQYATTATCSGENVQGGGQPRDVVIRVRLESGNTFYCQDNR